MKAGLTAPSFLRIRHMRRGAWGALLAPVSALVLVVGLALVGPALVGVRAAPARVADGAGEAGAMPALALDGQGRLVNGDATGLGAVWARVLPRGLARWLAWGGAAGSGDAPEHTPPLTLVWSSSELDATQSVAWGDVDGDGDLDLAVGNCCRQPNRLYRNEGGVLTSSAVWSSVEGDGTDSVAWGDVDGDGDLDLAVGNEGGQPNRLYRNEGGVLTSSAVWSSVEGDDTQSVAWGDVDGDGDLDLAVGNYGPNRLYRNEGGVLTSSAVWSSVEGDRTQSVAWGDVDGDGDLDLAVGNAGNSGSSGQPNRLYRNEGGELTSSAVWSSSESDATQSVAWGDVDGDGDLDLAAGNYFESNRLYRNEGGMLTGSAVWSSVEAGNTRSVAWGDVDGDGDLDLAVGNDGGPNRLYRNEGGVLTSSAVWSSVEGDGTRSVAWGDVDGDGDLDLAVGNDGGPNRLYRNEGGVLTSSAVWSAVEMDDTSSVAWGDVDGDGDLDLAVGNIGQPNRLYRNEGGVLTSSAAVEAGNTLSVAWGDVDGDGDLDLAVGNSGQPNRLYRNERGVLTSSAVWSSVEWDYTKSVAWGDVDGDGDLDLAVGNSGQPNRLYRNEGGVLTSGAVWSSVETDGTTSVAWGDVDGDGDLDLAVGNIGQPNRLYRNEGGVLTSSAVWSSDEADQTYSVAWGDVDGDGDLDLAVGNIGQPNRLYRNEGGVLTSSAVWSSVEADVTVSVAWGDVDGDGDLDLAVGNYGQPNRLYRNEGGVLTSSAVWSSVEADVTVSVAWGDVDGDGDPDLAVGNRNQPNRLYRNTRDGRINQAHNLLVQVGRPAPPDDAAFYSSAHVWSDTAIPITYTLSDGPHASAPRPQLNYAQYLPVFARNGHMQPVTTDAVRTLRAYYSLNGGGHWLPAVATSSTLTTNLGVGTHTYMWDIFASGLFGQYDNVTFRIEAIPANRVAGPFLYGRAVADTFPFRVRGTQVRVLSGTLPVENALVYRWPAGQAGDGEPLADGGGQPLLTNNQGYLAGQSRLTLGDRLVALWPVTSTRAYTLYYTSAAPTLGGLDAYTMTVPGVQTMTVSSAHPLMLFNLNVALEWDARNDAQFLSRLQFDLRRTAQFLFDWTNGQATLGSVTIYQDRAHWDDADVRVYATNRMRPMAAIGGIVSAATSDPVTSTLVYEPGMVHIGAVWNRYGDPSGELGEDWPRTLAHELGHYALFLDDDYLGLDDNGYLVGVETCASAMSDPYRDDYTEFHSAAQWQAECGQTLAQRTTGRWDWATVTTFYPWLDGTTDNAGPSSLPLNVTQISVVEPITPTQTLPDARFFLRDASGSPLQPGVSARGYLFDGARMTALGRPVFDALTARGARPGARVCVFEPEAERLGCKTIQDGDTLQLTVRDLAGWQPDVLISPVTSRTVNLRVQNVAAGLSLRARLYAGTGPTSDVVTLTETSGVYSGTFALSAPTLDGYVQVWVEEGEPRREVLTQYALGGNPGHMRGGLGHMRGGLAPALSPDGQAILYASTVAFPRGEFFTLQAATYLPAVPSWASVAGHGYWLSASAGAPSLDGLHSLSFSYMGNEVAAGAEDWLRVYYWTGTQWVALETVLDTRENVAIARTRGAGLYALMASLEVPLYGPGWNQVAYYPGATQAVTQALASVAGSYRAVYGRVVTDTLVPWRVYAPSAPGWVNDLDTLEFSHGYWITVTQDVVWRVHGPGDGVDVLSSGGATPLTLQPPATYYGEVHAGTGFTPTVSLPVKAWVNGVLCGQGVTQMQGGVVVYRVHVEAERTGYAGCGARGRQVVFDVGPWRMATVASWSNELVWDLPLWADPLVGHNKAP